MSRHNLIVDAYDLQTQIISSIYHQDSSEEVHESSMESFLGYPPDYLRILPSALRLK